MLALKSHCERCDALLAPDSNKAVICSFECTFCARCNHDDLKGICPNCIGDLQQRPARQIYQQ
ncbi:MAG: DUF1272 domain-containing protein [Porticoccaceae bacterium]